jgi:hypothetical protein
LISFAIAVPSRIREVVTCDGTNEILPAGSIVMDARAEGG